MSFNLQNYIGHNKIESHLLHNYFSPYAQNQARNIINGNIEDNAKKRENREAITIDGIQSKDLDDAIWVEKTKNGYLVQIHIADPTAQIPKYSPLDLEAIKRSTSIYREEYIYNMYPDSLANDYFSLNENGKKLTLSIDIEIDSNGNIKDFRIYESLLKNIKRHSYESFINDFINPDSHHHKQAQLFYEIAKIRRKHRKRSGANLDFDDANRKVFFGKKEGKIIQDAKKIPSMIVEECAILGNICAAIFMVKNDLQKVFRVHKEIDEKAFYDTRYPGHKALAYDFYTHFTSPIRRYPDNTVHRIIKDFLNNRNSIYENGEIKQIIDFNNLRIFLVNNIGKILDKEDWGTEKVERIREIYSQEDLRVGHYKTYIRNAVNDENKLPESLKKEILHLISKGNIGDFSWCIGLFLLSGETEIKELLKKKIIKNYETTPKKIIGILNNTKIMKGDDFGLFEIVELENEVEAKLEITVTFRGKKIITLDDFYENEKQKNLKKGFLRRKTMEEIFDFFM